MVILQLHEQPALIQAIFAGDLEASRAILNSNVDVNLQDSEKRTALHAAAFKADADIITSLLEAGARVNAKDAKWVTPLHRACSINADKVVSLLLNAEAEPGARDRLWQTPLHIAASNNAYECVELLVDHIPNLDVTDRSGKTALHHAAHNGHTYIVDFLISKGGAVNASDKKYHRPLHFAAQMGHFKTIDLLIKCGADINASDCNQCTPLHMAAANGNDSVCRVLLNAGADKDAQNTYGNTPLHIACLNGQQLVCQDLISAGADPEAVNFQGQTPLYISAACAHGAECMMYLLSQKVDVNKRSLDGRTPLHMTAIHGKFTRSTALIEHGATIDCTDKNGLTPLHITAQYGHDLLATTLMSFGANPSFKGYEGRTPLHISCLSGHVECCRKFLMAGVDLNAVDDTGKTPIHYAAYKGSVECIDLLVSNGAKFCERDNIGRIPLHYAAAQDHFQCARTLINIGSPKHAEDNQGCTPLHLAAGHNLHAHCVEYFGDFQNIYADKKGFTPLHYAVAANNTRAVSLLLSKFDYDTLERISRTLMTPLHFAAKVGDIDILIDLLEAGPDLNAQDEQGTTPLMLAVHEGQLHCAIKLVRCYASVTICDKIHNMTAVHYCAKNGYHMCLDEIFSTGDCRESIEMTDSLQRTPLMLAVYSNHIECVKVLLKYAVDVEKVVNMMDNDSHSSLFIAVALGHSEIVQLLLTNKAKANLVDVNGKSVIHLAAGGGHLTCLKMLIDYLEPKEAAAMDRQGCTALHWASYRGNSSCVEFLLQKDIFKTLQGNEFSAVHCASYSGSVQCLRSLISYFGKDIVNLQDSRKRSPLHICALHGHTEAAKLLLDNGATLDIVDEDERTPFTAATQFAQNDIIELFMKFNVDETQQDKFGNTALHWACLMKHTSTAVLLLKDMKDYNVIHSINKENKTALHLAARNGLVYVTKELLRKGASVFAVDSEGHTPALCCAPNDQVAQCLALILLNSKKNGPGESDSKKSLNSFLQKNSLKHKKSSILKKSVHTQTDRTLLRNSYVSASDKIRLRFKPPVWPNSQKVLSASHFSSVRPLYKSSWKKDQDHNCEDEDICFLIDNSEQNDNSSGLEIENDKGMNLHRSFSDMSISSHNGGKINLEETLRVRNLKELSDRKKDCKECILWQKRCTDCTMRHLLRQQLQGKRSPREFNEFLLKSLHESSSDYRNKLLNALEALGKEFESSYNKELTTDLRRVVRLGRNKKFCRNRRMLCKMEPENMGPMVRKTPSAQISPKQPKNFRQCERMENCKSAEAILQNDYLNVYNAPKSTADQIDSCRNQYLDDSSVQGHALDKNKMYQTFVSELLNEEVDRFGHIFQPEFLKKLQEVIFNVCNVCDAEYSTILQDNVQKLLKEYEITEIYSSEVVLKNGDLLDYLENFVEKTKHKDEFNMFKEKSHELEEEKSFEENTQNMMSDINMCEDEMGNAQILCELPINSAADLADVEDEIYITEENDLIEEYLLPPIKVTNGSTDDLNCCIDVIPVKFIIDVKKEHMKTTKVYMIDKDSSEVITGRNRDSGKILDVPFITEESSLEELSLIFPSKPKLKTKKDFSYSFQRQAKKNSAKAKNEKKNIFSTEADGPNKRDSRDATNENSEFSDNEFY